MRRYGLRDDQWDRIKDLLPGRSGSSIRNTAPSRGTIFCPSVDALPAAPDLAIIVTPRIVRPARPGDPVKTPLDNTLPANDIDLFLMGKPEITPADLRLALGHQKRFVGHILDLPKRSEVNVVVVKN